MTASAHPVRVGTSGYSFKDWVGPFYPPGTRPEQQLEHYAQHFDCLELNVTYYRIPDAKLLAGFERRTPPGFAFIVKLHGDITHKRSDDPALDSAFHQALEPLRAADKMQGLLAQFPYSFHNTAENRAYLARLRTRYPDDALFLEFRHTSWTQSPVFDFLRNLRLAWVCVDEPPLPNLIAPRARTTTAHGYVRLHGRNAAAWYAGGEGGSDRYDYLYSESELREWAEKIKQMVQDARQTWVFFNNCHAGQAPVNAQAMKDLLAQML
jgi:uncharacterized protein YecE (DUF72 family)